MRRFENIINLLQCAFETEEEDEKKGIVTFVNFYAKVIQDVEDDSFVEGFRNLITENTEAYPFLSHDLILEVLSLDIEDRRKAYESIQALIEEFLEHPLLDTSGFLPEVLYIEDGTLYADIISKQSISFDVIRSIAVSACDGAPVELEGRGVQPLQEEEEMYSYLYRYGTMHKAKLESALEFLPAEELNTAVDVIDWGCGQGLASVVLCDYIKKYVLPIKTKSFTLIEPSELALSRAALHVKHACPDVAIQTYCLGFDSLQPEYLLKGNDRTKIHLFSNVLDLSGIFFSQNQLIETIENSCRGRNYFVIASPYSDDIKADQIDAFKRYFMNNYSTAKLYGDVSNSKSVSGTYWNCNQNYKDSKCFTHSGNGCNSRWTRIVKVFSVVI
ncbi:MAG: hypothetical protein LUE98_09675 [Tannerellaceae bacterium]|nr:hypothetical protein [Tannerellaceae bacterium]